MRTLPIALLSGLILCNCSSPPAKARSEAQQAWKKHESVLEAVATGRQYGPEEFYDACIFFERVAGIQVPGDASTYVDWHPTPDTASALPEIQQWYKAHKNRLYWDAEKEEVILLPQSPET
jgi:hypothetical protein